MDTSRFYVGLDSATAMLAARQPFREQVEAWWLSRGWGLPPFFVANQEPVAALCRQVATARYEDVVFAGLAKRAGLRPVWPEYLGDTFVDSNSYKRSLVHRHICRGIGKRGGLKLGLEKLAAPAECNGRQLRDIVVGHERRPLTNYHHEVQNQIISDAVRFDVTAWLKSIDGGRASDYYAASLSLFIAHGVLFEDYHGGESGGRLNGFTATVFEPAWRSVTERFGAAPLIVPLPWKPEFAYYPADATRDCLDAVRYP